MFMADTKSAYCTSMTNKEAKCMEAIKARSLGRQGVQGRSITIAGLLVSKVISGRVQAHFAL